MQKTNGIPMGNPPVYLLEQEQTKSRLLLQAQLFKAQQRYREMADNFAQAADVERQWAEWAESENLTQLAIIHRYSELSCWAQAGYPHRALHLLATLLTSSDLTPELQNDLDQYQAALQSQFINWMSEWSSLSIPPASTPIS